MSSKSQVKSLLARSLKVTDHHLLSNPHYHNYQQDLDHNLTIILHKYAHLDRQKVSDLLEELGNNRELAMQILDQEESSCNAILEERREVRKLPVLTQEEENRILKQSFLNLYKKLLAKTAQLEEAHRKYESERAENQKLKQMNQYLLSEKYAQPPAHDTPPIC